jgi:hypothetical protein
MIGKRLLLFLLGFLLLLMILAVPVGGRKLLPALAPGEQSFSGTVEAMNEHTCEICKCIEISATVKTSGQLIEVKLGPKTFLEERKFYLRRGNAVDVTGIRYTERRKEVALALEVRRGGEKLVLRGKAGRPIWMGEHGHICPVCGI